MRRCVSITLGAAVMLCLAGGSTAGDGPGLKLEYCPVKQIEVVHTFTLCPVGAEVKEWAVVCQKPPTLLRQQVTVKLEPGGRDGITDGLEKLPLVFIRRVLPRPQKDLDITYTLTYYGTMCRADLVPLKDGETPPHVRPLTDTERALYTASSRFCDYESPIVKGWLNKEGFRRIAGESDVSFARRVYLALPHSLAYNMNNNIDQLKASAVVRAHVGVCQGLSQVFAAAMRANGIPARCFGLFLGAENVQFEVVGGKIAGQDNRGFLHANNEFYAEGIGWVPVDVTPCLNVHVAPGRELEAQAQRLETFGHDKAQMLILWEEEPVMADTVSFGRSDKGQSADFREKFPKRISDHVRPGDDSRSEILWTGGVGTPTLRREQLSVKTLPLAPEPIDPAGAPGPAGMVPGGFRIWTDYSGWHVRSYSGDEKPHPFECTVSAESGTIVRHRLVGQSKDQAATAKIVLDFKDSKERGVDFAVGADVKLLRFNLRVEGRDAAGSTFIGQKPNTCPIQMPFLLAAQAEAADSKTGHEGR